MEVGLFSKCIKELIGDLKQVAVPHLGIFSSELVGASYSDKQTTINPPYLRVSFQKKDVDAREGRAFLEKIAEAVNSDADQAEVELNWCISRICSELEGNKICSLPGLGLMKANSKNEFFFISSEETELYPDGLALEPISIKRRPETIAEQFEQKPQVISMSGLQPVPEPQPTTKPLPATVQEKVQEPAPAPKPEQKPKSEPAPALVAEPAPEQKPAKKPTQFPEPEPPKSRKPVSAYDLQVKARPRYGMKVLLAILILIVIAIIALYVCGKDLAYVMDSILYSAEDMELLRR